MPLPTKLLIHTATLTHTTVPGTDSYGQPNAGTTTSTLVACRFVGDRKTIVNGVLTQTSPRVYLAAGTPVSEGDTLTSTNIGFAETFRVNAVYQVYEAIQPTISHISCDIKAVV